jgi:hypothetical protein
VAIGIIFGATRIIFYSLTSAYVFQIPLRHRIWRKRVSPSRNVGTSEGEEQKLIYFRFQIDVLNKFYHFIEIALLHGIS